MTRVEKLKQKRVITKVRQYTIENYTLSPTSKCLFPKSSVDEFINKNDLLACFIFSSKPEGRDFWWDLYIKIEYNED